MKQRNDRSAEQDGGSGLSIGSTLELCIRHTRLVVIVSLATLGASMLWLSSKAPVYRAKATLILESGREKGGVLGELAALTSAPEASSEMNSCARARPRPKPFEQRPTIRPRNADATWIWPRSSRTRAIAR